MGRTIPSWRIVVEQELAKMNKFKQLLRVEDQMIFEDLLNQCKLYASAAGVANRYLITDAMFMSILFNHQKNLKEFKAALEIFKSTLQPQQ